MNFRLGCAIWAYKEWVGDLFPPGSRASEFLQLYSRRFTAVEGNTTFYSVPNAEMVQRWATETPPGFKFCLKLPRDVTHQGLLVPQIPRAIAFLEQMQGLGDRLGPIFAQLPPSYSPASLDDLSSFLTACATKTPLAVEVRHSDWFQPSHTNQLNAVLEKFGVGRVLLDTRPIYECPGDPQLNSERRKPKVPLQPTVTANFSLIRYISHPEQEMNQRFLAEWVTHVDQWLRQGTQTYFFVHCPVEARSPANARHFQQLLEQHGAPVPALPWEAIAPPPSQLSLF
ncbi:DUF72 domain-containing protein [Leptolyngbya sp. FACHB-541]|uniref:DUF72 domain-containing protein n=1 Tax=Leptolyngbya sp. FACHB-541 TaxID=2692810 RepID=UPI0016843FD7|nr:DUF72 domain-containing protein [Leptolyngbya sp. FACHB-541]MBD1995636.1 DUF72 domain-containing protein [Leptolyngbya sp. FACHB-541]